MKRLLSPTNALICAAVALLVVYSSSNLTLWAACLLTLPAMVWLAGGTGTYPVLLWILGICWFQIIGTVITADLEGRTISDNFASYDRTAILYSLCAMCAMALGMRLGTKLHAWTRHFFRRNPKRMAAASAVEYPINMGRLLVVYFACSSIAAVLGIVAWKVPSLAQPILAVTLIRYVGIYLLAVTVIEAQRGYIWLALVAAFEVVTGMISFFASYKEAIFVILLAFASARQKVKLRTIAFSVAAAAGVFYISIIWTIVKNDYRNEMGSMTLQQKFSYMADEYLSGTFDYRLGLNKLFERIGYTNYYAQVLARQDAGLIASDYDFYEKAVIHILTPRFLFPDKAALDDSTITSELTGIHVSEGTSIAVGYVAEAQVDFGFPGLLIPLGMIGMLLGAIAQYFMTRQVPLRIRQAFTVATLFLSFYFETDVDKSLGSLIMGSLVMAMILRFGYPAVAPWLAGLKSRPRAYAAQYGR